MVLIKLPYKARYSKYWNPNYNDDSQKMNGKSKKPKKRFRLDIKKYKGDSVFDPYEAYLHEKEFHRKYGY